MLRNLKAATPLRAAVALSGLLSVSLFAATQASAGCGDPAIPGKGAAGHFVPAVYHPGESAGFMTVSELGLGQTLAPIVGLWKFEVHLNGAQNGLPDGFLFDWGLAQWHADHTEIQFSAGRPPVSGDVCMGAWEQVGWSKFKLNHIALGLTPPDGTGVYIGPANIRAEVTVDKSGDYYSGPFTLTQYAASVSSEPFSEFDQSTPLVTFKATITAHRISAD